MNSHHTSTSNTHINSISHSLPVWLSDEPRLSNQDNAYKWNQKKILFTLDNSFCKCLWNVVTRTFYFWCIIRSEVAGSCKKILSISLGAFSGTFKSNFSHICWNSLLKQTSDENIFFLSRNRKKERDLICM